MRILKWLPKSAKTAIFENRGFLRNPADRTKIALARAIFEQMTPNLLHLKGMSYICVIVAQNWALSLILGLQFWSKVKNSKFRDTPFFRRANFAGPGVGPKKIFGPENCFAVLHMSQLEF